MLVKLKPSFSEMSQCLPAVWPVCKQLRCWCQSKPPGVSPCVCLLECVFWEQNVVSCINTHFWMLGCILFVCWVCCRPWCQMVWRAVQFKLLHLCLCDSLWEFLPVQPLLSCVSVTSHLADWQVEGYVL